LSVIIRNFIHPQDYLAVIELWRNSGPGIQVRRSDEPDEIFKKLTRDPDLFIVAENDGKIIGSVIGGFDGRRGFIYHLAVEKPFQNLGIGKSLMNEVEKRLKRKGCIRAYLFVTKANQQVIDFYKHLDWELMDVLPMGKDL
jgi:ribosomal protein S18 acetylase RimI-like enzyme